MGKNEHSKYQKKVISRYYSSMDNIMLQKLGELVTELYLAQTDKKKDKLWERVEKAMMNLKVKSAIREHIMAKRSIEILAKNLKDWLGNKI